MGDEVKFYFFVYPSAPLVALCVIMLNKYYTGLFLLHVSRNVMMVANWIAFLAWHTGVSVCGIVDM